MTNILAKCINLAGNAQSGVLLYRVAFWHPRTKITRLDKPWVVFSHEQWMVDAALSASGLDRAWKRLKDASLVEIEHHLFGSKRYMFVRLSHRAMKELGHENGFSTSIFHPEQNTANGAGANPANGAGANPESGAGDSLGSGAGDSLESGALFMIEEEIEEEIGEEIEEVCEVLKHPANEEAGTGKETGKMKVSEVLAQQAAKKMLHKPDSKLALEFTWKSVIAEVYETPMVYLTKKQSGQLALFKKKCPEGKSVEILETILRDWIKYVKRVETVKGITKTPSEPTLDFLLYHADVAVAVAQKQSDVPVVQSAFDPGSNLTPNVQLTSQTADEKPMTYEEFLDSLKPGKK